MKPVELLTVFFFPLALTLAAHAELTPQEARAIAKEAYIYGNPIVDSYRILHSYCVDTNNPEFKAPWNHLRNISRVFTPQDKAVQTPNSDTPYSMIGLDLRSEPMVLTVPSIEPNRYFSIQLIDSYTYNFDYIGSRATGNDGGTFVVAGPRWKGQTPKGVTKVLLADTDLVLAIYRTQLFNPGDLENVRRIQEGYKAEPLSKFLGQPAPDPAPPIDWIQPLTREEQNTSLEFFNILNFVLRFCPTLPSEEPMMERFAKIGVGAGRTIDIPNLEPEMKKAIAAGIDDAWQAFKTFQKTEIETGKVNSGDLFGAREYLKDNYLYRFAAAVMGIYGNSKSEAIYPFYRNDRDGQALDASKHDYIVKFASNQLPPVNAFWSLTMYNLPESLLVDNPINRYLINSPMLPNLQFAADGSLTFYIQKDSPGKEMESNWLPAPDGPFWTALRLYWPKEEALDGTWKQPPMERKD